MSPEGSRALVPSGSWRPADTVSTKSFQAGRRWSVTFGRFQRGWSPASRPFAISAMQRDVRLDTGRAHQDKRAPCPAFPAIFMKFRLEGHHSIERVSPDRTGSGARVGTQRRDVRVDNLFQSRQCDSVIFRRRVMPFRRPRDFNRKDRMLRGHRLCETELGQSRANKVVGVSAVPLFNRTTDGRRGAAGSGFCLPTYLAAENSSPNSRALHRSTHARILS